MIVNPFDPLGVLKSWTEQGRRAQEAADRIVAQQRQAQRAAALGLLVADVDTAYALFKQHPDDESAGNLADAIDHYRKAATDV